MDEDFEETVLGKRILKMRKNPDMVSKMNDFVTYMHLPLWEKTGKNNPFIDDEVSVALFMKANM